MAYFNLSQNSHDEMSIKAPSSHHRNLSKPGGIEHAKRDIILAMASVSLPMLILGGILVGLVWRYRLDQSDPWFLSIEHQGADLDSTAFYLNMSATRFVTVASWVSTVAASFSGLIMVIFSYQVANNLLQASEGKMRNKHCPTPFQLNLFIQARTGSVSSIWEIVKYQNWNDKAESGFMLTHTTAVLLATFILSYTIWGLDTWLHLSTTATLLTRSLADPTTYHYYGRHISCDETMNTYDSCSTNWNGMALVTEAFQNLNNMSSINMVSTFQNGSQTFAYVTDPQIERGHSFLATTLAIETQCAPVLNSDCDLTIRYDDTHNYVVWSTKCTAGEAKVRTSSTSSGMNTSIVWLDRPDITQASWIKYATTNPFYFMVGTVSASMNSDLAIDDRAGPLQTPGRWYIGFSLNCTSTVYDIQYRWINGSFSSLSSSTMSDNIMGNTFSAPFQTGIGLSTVFNAAATAVGSPTMDTVADTFSTVFSKTAMSLGASVATPRRNINEGVTLTGARVPKKPLVALLVVVLLYAVWGLILGALALLSRSQDVDEVQTRLTIAGIIATCFETPSKQHPISSTEDLFTEPVVGKKSARLRMASSEDYGFEWKSTMI